MGLSDAHKGYEYQDLLTSYFIINDLLKGNNSEFKVDMKEYDDDKFDDLTVINSNEIVKRQIKYSDNKTVAKDDFSSIDYDLALDVLYNSWDRLDKKRNVSIKILLAWDYNDDIDFLEELGTSDDFSSPSVKQYGICIDKIWFIGEERPISSWKRLRNNAANISRDCFKEFLQDLKVELCLPKASLDIVNKGELERITVERIKDFGVGIYPNHEISPEGVLLKLMNIVKSARANQRILKTDQIVSALGLVVGYGNIEQLFPVDSSSNIYDENTFRKFYSNICKNNKTMLIQLVEDMYSYKEKEEYKLVNLGDYTCINGDDGFLLKFLLNDKMEERVKPKFQATDQDFNDLILRDFKSIYPRYKLLENRGVSVDDYILGFFSDIHSESIKKVLSETYIDNKSSLLMDNIQIHSDYLKALGNAVINYLCCRKEVRSVSSRHRSLDDSEYFYHSIREDVLLLNAIINSAIARPNGIPHPTDVKDIVSGVDERDWVRLAYIEREYVYAEDLWRSNYLGDNCKIYQICSAVGFGKSKRLPLYHDSYRGTILDHIYPTYMRNPKGLKGKEVVVFTDACMRYNPFLTYYRYDYLALTIEVLSLLEITMASTDKGLIGKDSGGKCVLKYQNWCTHKYLTGEQERTPVLRGSQLLVSKETFNKLVSEIGYEPYCHTTSELIFGE